jgi:hypothetical protein
LAIVKRTESVEEVIPSCSVASGVIRDGVLFVDGFEALELSSDPAIKIVKVETKVRQAAVITTCARRRGVNSIASLPRTPTTLRLKLQNSCEVQIGRHFFGPIFPTHAFDNTSEKRQGKINSAFGVEKLYEQVFSPRGM